VHVDDCRGGEAALSMTYYLNRLQRLSSRSHYCVTLNDRGAIAEDTVLRRIAYEHPLYSFDMLQGQRLLQALSGERHTYYSGAYLGYGFHEDGVASAVNVVRSISGGRAAA
jgi:predicted NAD/FAD-binding protein